MVLMNINNPIHIERLETIFNKVMFCENIEALEMLCREYILVYEREAKKLCEKAIALDTPANDLDDYLGDIEKCICLCEDYKTIVRYIICRDSEDLAIKLYEKAKNKIVLGRAFIPS